MLKSAATNKLIEILRKDARRILRMRVPGFANPYYAAFLLRDIEWFNTWASSGSMYRRRADHTRNVYCDIRVGTYRFDQTTEGGLHDNDEEIESFQHINVPIDDTDYDGLRLALWRLSESKFREAVTAYNEKVSSRLSKVDPNGKLHSFSKLKPQIVIQPARPERVDEEFWVKFCKRASKWMSALPNVSASWVEFDVTQESRIFVSTEGRVIVQHSQVFSLCATFRKLTKEGSMLEQELVINCGTQRELPDMRKFKRMALRKYQQLQKLWRARKIHAFSGPVLLYPLPAGLLFHEAIGHRLEGSRLLASGEGQTFKGQIGQRVLNVDLSVIDNPKMKSFRGVRCIGSYDFDDEGSPGKTAPLIKDGTLVDFLTTRAECYDGSQSNGHARTSKHQRPISRMAVTVVQGKHGLSLKELRQKLIEEIRAQDKPFGMIVYDTAGGETETTSYNFQAFSGEISFATLVYPDGREVCVRGVNFVGTPLQALNNIVAYGNELEIDNGYCGAESGMIPVTTISPAVLLSNLELQAKDEELVTQSILPRPKLTKLPARRKARTRSSGKARRR